jgi:drug/metabolite transporter (DMT)-like permease
VSVPVATNWRLGLALASTTAVLWATLPIALKAGLEVLDFWTLTWFRFLVALICTLIWVASRRQLGGVLALRGRGRGLLALAAAGLIGNYVLYLVGLKFTTPANAQLLIQLAPLLLAFGAAWVFRERLSAGQLLGFLAIGIGLSGFFIDQRQQVTAQSYGLGALLIVLAAISWAIYGLAQKALQRSLNSQQILLVIYAVAAVVLLPLASPAQLLALDGAHWMAVLYCCFNTVAAYGAFAEAMARWEAARVSAVLAITPLLTLAVVSLVSAWIPGTISPERLGWLGVIASLASRKDAPAPVGARQRD